MTDYFETFLRVMREGREAGVRMEAGKQQCNVRMEVDGQVVRCSLDLGHLTPHRPPQRTDAVSSLVKRCARCGTVVAT